MRKPRSDAKLLNLPPAQQDQIYTWLTEGVDGDTSYDKVKEQIYLDFNLKVSDGAMSDFWRKVVAPRKLRSSDEAAEFLVQAAMEDGTHFESAAIEACKQKAFEVMASSAPDPKMVIAFYGALLESQKIAYKREDLALKRDRFKAAIAKKIDLALEELYAEIASNPEALVLFNRMRGIIKKGVAEG